MPARLSPRPAPRPGPRIHGSRAARRREEFEQLKHQQGGAFTVQQAVRAGLSYSTMRSRRDLGVYVTLQPGVLVSAEVPPSRDLLEVAAVLTCQRRRSPDGTATPPFGLSDGIDAVLSHHTAARRHELRACPASDAIHVSVAWERRLRPRDGVVIHRTRLLDQSQVTSDGGVPVTTLARTVRDVAGYLGPGQIRRLVAEVARRDRAAISQLERDVAASPRAPGSQALLPALAELSPLHAATRSELESRFVDLTTAAGITPTAMNHPVVDIHGRQRFIDAVYLPEHVPIELDGAVAHGSRLDRSSDLRRENAIILTGRWRSFLRFTWSDVRYDGRRVVSEIRAALEAARAERSGGHSTGPERRHTYNGGT